MSGAEAEAAAYAPDAHYVAQLLARLACNCHSIYDNNLDATGIRLGALVLPAAYSNLSV